MNTYMVKMVAIKDVPKKEGRVMFSLRSEAQILFVDILTMLFRLVVCEKKFQVESRPCAGQLFRLTLVCEKNAHYDDVMSFDLEGWQLSRVIFAIEAFKKYTKAEDSLKILMMLRHRDSLKWSMVAANLKSYNLEELAEAQAG